MEKLRKSVLVVALLTVVTLMVPLVAMQFTDGIFWSAFDFILAGTLLFGTGLSFVLVTRLSTNLIYRAAIAMALGTTLLMIWSNLAVGLIGVGPNIGNLMYMGVVAVVIIGSLLSRFNPGGMERAMYTSSLALVLVASVALLANMDEYPGSSMNEILGVNAFFAILYALSGTLFRFAAQASQEKSKG